MNRRELFKAFGGVATLGIVAAPQSAITKHGLLTVEGWQAHKHLTGEYLHTWVNGIDVTSQCYEANDVEGYALVYCRDQEQHKDWTKQGHLHRGEGGGACQFRLTGHVVIAPGKTL